MSRHKYAVTAIKTGEAPIVGYFPSLKASKAFIKDLFPDDRSLADDIESKDSWSFLGNDVKAHVERVY